MSRFSSVADWLVPLPVRCDDIATKHAAAGVREDGAIAHPRHTSCTMLAELEVIRALAGHIDIRTTQIYINVTDLRKADGIAAFERTRYLGFGQTAHNAGIALA
jgi:integrase